MSSSFHPPVADPDAGPRVVMPRSGRQPDETHPYLEGIFAPVDREHVALGLPVRGALPRELNGLYARIGPNPLERPDPARYHWFAGAGMVHGVRLQDGQAQWYRSRWIGSNSSNDRLGRARAPGPRRGLFDTVNTNVFGHAGRIWASVEAGPLPVQLDGELNTLRHGLFDHPGRDLGYSAHPHRDPLTGELHAVCYDAMRPRRLTYVRVDAQGALARVVPIPVRHGPMVHDCAITRSSVVVLDLPVTFSWKLALRRKALPYAWNPRHEARVGLLPRDGDASQMRWYEVEPCYVFHPCNAYDLPDGGVMLDVVVHERMFHRSSQGPELDAAVRFERWTLPARGSQVQRQVVSEQPQEFPRLDERLVGAPYRYAYTAGVSLARPYGQPLWRHDLHTGTSQRHDFGPDRTPGEMVFVPRSEAAREDEGWLIGFVMNGRSGRTELHVLHADDLGGEPAAVVELPVRVPAGFHGNWIADRV